MIDAVIIGIAIHPVNGTEIEIGNASGTVNENEIVNGIVNEIENVTGTGNLEVLEVVVLRESTQLPTALVTETAKKAHPRRLTMRPALPVN